MQPTPSPRQEPPAATSPVLAALPWRALLPALVALLLVGLPGVVTAQEVTAQVPVETFQLDNGMEFLLVEKPEMTTVSAGWVAHVGSSNERPGITGLSHFFEHMMFKGSHTIGTRDIDRDLAIIGEQEALQEQIRALYARQRERARLGEIDNPFDPAARPPELVELETRFAELVEEQRELLVSNEFDQIYTENGASGMNAFTTEDMTGYFITVPANKVELWMWMESDRLANPVFREFYAERDVVYEERRLRTESSPTGEFDEQFQAMFWQSHPYSWPVVGWPSDLEVITKEQADAYYDTYYAPNNLTAILVGNFDRGKVETLARHYFGALSRGEHEPPDVVTLEMPQQAEKRMLAECDCPPQVQIWYHTVPFRHRDSYALDVLAELLNGRTGRLNKKLVLEQQIASTARASQNSNKWAGYFSVQAEARGESTPEELEQAWYDVLAGILDEPIPAEELEKVKNGLTADSYRRLENPFFLLIQLIFYEGQGDWHYINEWPEKTLAVTGEDVQRVAREYLVPKNRAVALYRRLAGTSAEEPPPELAGLPPQVRQQIEAQLRQIRQSEDPERLRQGLAQLDQMRAQMPPQMQQVLPLVERALRQRLEELTAAEEGGGDAGMEEEDGDTEGGAR